MQHARHTYHVSWPASSLLISPDLQGDRGTGKTTTIRALADLLPEIKVGIILLLCPCLISGETGHPQHTFIKK